MMLYVIKDIRGDQTQVRADRFVIDDGLRLCLLAKPSRDCNEPDVVATFANGSWLHIREYQKETE